NNDKYITGFVAICSICLSNTLKKDFYVKVVDRKE
ncbi:unnamed protein product, partial [marine sediment metagenome]